MNIQLNKPFLLLIATLVLLFSGCTFRNRDEIRGESPQSLTLVDDSSRAGVDIPTDKMAVEVDVPPEKHIPTEEPEPTATPIEKVAEVEPELPPSYYLSSPEKDHIKRCRNYFLNKYRYDYLNALERRKIYGEMISRKLRERNLPEDFKWIPLVETWFVNGAYSSSHAAGLWQLMPATARSFGLRIDDWIDQRKDPDLATDAALDVLVYLYEKTDDWLLTIAAYNTGEGCVRRAIKRVNSRNYWDLAAKKALPSQTRFYVAAILALSEIERNAVEYGIEIPPCESGTVVRIPLTKQVNLNQLASGSGLDLEMLKRLNSSFKTAITPPDSDKIELRCPIEFAEQVTLAIENLNPHNKDSWVIHTIKPGDTISALAKRYSSTVEAIVNANKINKHLIVAGEQLFIPSDLTWN